MPYRTNEQSLLQDYADQVFSDLRVGAVSFDWTGARTLSVLADPSDWPRIAVGIERVQTRAADQGFKVLLRSLAQHQTEGNSTP